MARTRRPSAPGVTYHVIQRGNNRGAMFRGTDDYQAFLALLGKYAQREGAQVHSYALLTTHVHLIVTPAIPRALSRTMQFATGEYVRKFNGNYGRIGGLYNGRYRSVVVGDERYWYTCMRYVELNPIRAGMAALGDYPWSSYAAHAHGRPDPVITPHRMYLALGPTPADRQRCWRLMCGDAVSDRERKQIREAAHRPGGDAIIRALWSVGLNPAWIGV